jgi:hypothetical protein
VWETTVDDRTLHFHLAGINNQNFIMRDDETGSWWQQVTGEAILGPLKGRRLNQVVHDEIAFSVWKVEQPTGRVLKPDERVANKYEPADWEERYLKFPVPTSASALASEDDSLPPRTLVVGIAVGVASKAYPFSKLQQHQPILDDVGGTAVLLVMDEAKQSFRAFDRSIDGRALEFFAKPDASPVRFVDADTSSEWDFAGRATNGPLVGKQLRKLPTFSDYWFDWKTYHPNTTIF